MKFYNKFFLNVLCSFLQYFWSKFCVFWRKKNYIFFLAPKKHSGVAGQLAKVEDPSHNIIFVINPIENAAVFMQKFNILGKSKKKLKNGSQKMQKIGQNNTHFCCKHFYYIFYIINCLKMCSNEQKNINFEFFTKI